MEKHWLISAFKSSQLTCIVMFTLTLLFLSTSAYANQTNQIRYIESKKYPDPKQSYFVDLLTLILNATKEEFGDYTLKPVAFEMSQARTSASLKRNEFIDIHWRMTSQQLEQDLQAIYIPILKGLMGYRIFIIRKGEQDKFSRETSLTELQERPLGQGYNWPDTEILEDNNFNVVKGYDIYLLSMLKKNRFDYFPRALHEPWFEVKTEPSLVIEDNFLLKYPAPMFFFINKNNLHLKKRLELGFSKIIESGVFEHFFQSHPVTANLLTKVNFNHRISFTLTNASLTERTKALIKDERLWINTKIQNEQ